MSSLIRFIYILGSFLNPHVLIIIGASTALGIVVGAIPGLTATLAIALLTSLTFGLESWEAFNILVGVYVGAMFGGSLSAILLNIPGTGSASATVLDGYPLSLQGKAYTAISLSRIGAFFGTLIGFVFLISIAPPLMKAVLRFTSFEMTTLAIFAVLVAGTVSSPDLPIKGWIGGLFGLLLSFVGMESIWSYNRFTFGLMGLSTGIPLIPVLIGFFGIPQIIKILSGSQWVNPQSIETKEVGIVGQFKLGFKYSATIIRSGIIGAGVGAIPGIGGKIAAWLSYEAAYKSSKNREKFGKGAYEGVMAPEIANNACCGGALIPTLTLGIPGDPPTAVFLAALMLHGVTPGPLLSIEHPDFIFQMAALLFIASFMVFGLGLVIAKPVCKIFEIPPAILMPMVTVMCIIGGYALNTRITDVFLLFVFGIIGYFLTEMGYHPAPIVLGLLLGGMIDENLRRALMISDGSILPFLTRPISLVFILVSIYIIISQTSLWRKIWQKQKKNNISNK